MADWYVDAGISGGNGTHPSTAFPSVTSITWGAGDRAWLRRTHYETVAESVFVGPQFTVGAHARRAFIIGWPDSGDPFFDERPAAGVSSNWDADVPSTSVYSVYGLKFPTISNSNNAAASGIQLGKGSIFANIAFQNSGGGTFLAFRARADVSGVIADNIILLASGGPMNRINQDMVMNFGKVTLALSGSGGGNGLFADAFIRHVVFHALSVYSGGWLRGTTLLNRFGTIENRSNSIDYHATQLSGFQGNTNPVLTQVSVERFAGTEPYSGAIIMGGLNGWPGMAVEDYHGQGPRIIGGVKSQFNMVSSADAMHNGSRVVKFEVASEATANQNYMTPIQRFPMLRKFVDVISGTPLTMRVPIYVGSSAVFSPAGGMIFANLCARGALPQFAVQSSVLVGSPTQWSGNLVSGGSAYLWEMKFFPQETGQVPLEIYAPMVTQATSGTGIRHYSLFSQPYSL